jgi:hypothetical protein
VENPSLQCAPLVYSQTQGSELCPSPGLSSASSSTRAQRKQHLPLLSDTFGYVEESTSTTISLLSKLGIRDDRTDIRVPPHEAIEVEKVLSQLPSLPILDFLVQYFVAEVNWSVGANRRPDAPCTKASPGSIS